MTETQEKPEQLTGWRHPASRYMRTKSEIESHERQIARLRRELEFVPPQIAEHQRQLAELKAAFLVEEMRVTAEAGDELIGEFLKQAAALDEAFTAEVAASWKRLALTLRSPPHFRVAVSYEAMALNISRLMQSDPKARAYRPLRHKSFVELSCSWLRPAETKAA